MFKTKNSDITEPADSGCESNAISFLEYRERRKQIKSVMAPDKNPLPPCNMAMAA
jgi:hypothetical protein